MTVVVSVDTQSGFIETDNDRLIMVILLIFFPPLSVFFKSRGCSIHVFLNVLLYLLFLIPAYIHATWICFIRGRQHQVRAEITNHK